MNYIKALLTNAAVFLDLGARYAPDFSLNDQNKATSEWLRTKGLATVMHEVAEKCREAAASPTINSAICSALTEDAARRLISCVEMMPNGQHLIRIGRADEYNAALRDLCGILDPAKDISGGVAVLLRTSRGDRET